MDTIIDYFGLRYDFVQYALMTGTIAAILGAVVGYFVMVRNLAFAAHALSHIGFAGAGAAALLGFGPLQGMLVFTIVAGLFMGVSGDRLQRSDMAIGMVLSFSLGLGSLFLYLSRTYAGQKIALLFGQILGISPGQVIEMGVLAALSLGALSIFSRRLLFASVQPRLAEARGLSLTGLSVAFMCVLAVSVSLASQVVGTLLTFTLVIAPAGIALRLCRSFWSGMATAVALNLVVVWSGILLSSVTNWPASFWITSLFFVIYLAVEGGCRLRAM